MTERTIYQIRRENLAAMLAEPGAKTALAVKLGVTQARVTQLLKPDGPGARRIHEDTARAIESARGLQPGELDADHSAPRAARPAKAPPATAVPDDLLEAAVRAVLESADKLGVNAPPAKAAAIVRMVVEHARTTGRVDAAFVDQLVKLAI